jgi:hypothetical protein
MLPVTPATLCSKSEVELLAASAAAIYRSKGPYYRIITLSVLMEQVATQLTDRL